MTTTQKKINLDSVTAQALFKAVTHVTNEINDTMIKDYRKRNNPLKPIAQASEFYVQGIKDTIIKTSEGLDSFKDWSDLDLLNNKEGWEELGIVKGTLLSGMYQDTYGNSFLIPQTMAGVEIDTNSDEFQAWYLAFTSFPPSALLESQAKLNEILGRHFKDSNRTGRKKQGPVRGGTSKLSSKISLPRSSPSCEPTLPRKYPSQSDPISNLSMHEKQ
jgi:hypothetical protein